MRMMWGLVSIIAFKGEEGECDGRGSSCETCEIMIETVVIMPYCEPLPLARSFSNLEGAKRQVPEKTLPLAGSYSRSVGLAEQVYPAVCPFR